MQANCQVQSAELQLRPSALRDAGGGCLANGIPTPWKPRGEFANVEVRVQTRSQVAQWWRTCLACSRSWGTVPSPNIACQFRVLKWKATWQISLPETLEGHRQSQFTIMPSLDQGCVDQMNAKNMVALGLILFSSSQILKYDLLSIAYHSAFKK